MKTDSKISALESAFFKFCEKNNRLPEFTETFDSEPVGRWRWRINNLFHLKSIDKRILDKLEKLGFWNFSKDDWYTRYESLEFSTRFNEELSGSQLRWLEKQSELFRNFRLTKEKAYLLRNLNLDLYNLGKVEAHLILKWLDRFESVERFYNKYKHLPLYAVRGSEEFGFDLYDWLMRQRKKLREGKLPDDCLKLLNSLSKDWVMSELEKSFYEKVAFLKDYYSKYREYPDSDGWVVENRMIYRQGKMPKWKIKELEKLPEWEWSGREAKFYKCLEIVKDYIQQHQQLPVGEVIWKGLNVGSWLKSARTRYKEGGKYPNKDKAQLLERLPYFTWDVKGADWDKNLNLLKKYLNKYKKYPIPKEQYKGVKIGDWVGTQRTRYKRKTISRKEIRALEKLPEWSWNPFEEAWNQNYKILKELGLSKIDGNLQRWVFKQRTKFRKNKLGKFRIDMLEQLPEWSWNPYESQWFENFHQLKTYILTNKAYPDKASQLGKWVYRQKCDYRNKRMSQERIEKLKSLKKWKW